MIDGLKPYATMKDSGLAWVGRYPSHWKTEKGKWLFRKMERPTEPSDEVVTCFRDGTVTLRKNRRARGFTESIKEIGYQRVRRGDLVIHAMDAFAGAVGVSDSDGKCTPVYSICQPRKDANAYYYAYVIREMARSLWILAQARGIRERSTDFRYSDFGEQVLPVPPTDEQAAIARFLRYASAKINQYIRAKSKTLELFGERYQEGDNIKHKPFHSYTMKQAIDEGFILDVLKSYTPVDSYYKLVKTIQSDPEFDTKKAKKKLRRYVEGHEHAIQVKAEIMVDHFHEQVVDLRKIGGEARAMVVTGGVNRAIQYFHAVRSYLEERKSPYKAIVAFSGDHEFGGTNVTEASLNGFPSRGIADRIQEHPYRFLICADKFQTGYDEPLLHTMYVDKPLSGIKAVQTLSRLNRARPQKYDTFVLAPATIDEFVKSYLGGLGREKLDPLLDGCVAVYLDRLDEDGQVNFKGSAKAFVRSYEFLSAILPYTNAEWEKLSIFLTFLIPKLPAPKEEDLSKGILELIDMDSYRAEKKAAIKIQLPDQEGEIEPVPADAVSGRGEPELDRLSSIVKAFNDQFGNIAWTDNDRVRKLVTEEIPAKVSADKAYQNAKKNSDKQNARIEHDKALKRVMTAVLKDDAELYKQFSDNPDFRRWLTDMVFAMTYDKVEAAPVN